MAKQELPDFFKTREPTSSDLEHPKVRKIIAVYSVEDEIKKQVESFPEFLDSADERSQRILWEKSFQKILREVKVLKPKYSFLSMHASFFRRNRFFSLLDPDLIKSFKPDIFVTLIEDLFLIWRRVVRREKEEAPTASYFRLRDIASWRSVEILITDLLSNFLLQRAKKEIKNTNYVVAVKHPLMMFYGLLFQPNILKVYSSFPITKPRSDPAERAPIDAFRMRLHEKYTVFDPLTIDEKIMEILLDKYYPKDEKTKARSLNPSDELTIAKTDRWPLPSGFSLVEDEQDDYPIVLNAMEVQEVVQDVHENIETRDFRLIDQVQCLAAWRPYYEHRTHEGVSGEINYARNNANIPRHLYFPAEDGNPEESPFAAKGVPHLDLSKLYEALDKIQKSIILRKGGL